MERDKIKLTAKEEEIMNLFWSSNELFIRELLEMYDEPKPHFNTLSTIVRGLEEKGFIGHKSYGKTHQYFAIVSREEFKERSLKNLIGKYYGDSAFSAVSALVSCNDITAEQLKELLDLVEKSN